MELTHLALTNFRSYKKFAYDFGPTVIFVGPNGTGKTNLLEAVYLLAVMKSYRAVSDAEVIRFGEEFAKISGTVKRGRSTPDELEIIVYQGQKRAKKNRAAKPLSTLIGTLKAVLFSPEQLDIVNGAPRRRRRFLDSLLSQTDPKYTQNLLAYQKALHQRNALLYAIKEGNARPSELFFWDTELITAGKVIHEFRTRLLTAVNARITPLYQVVAKVSTALTVVPQLQVLTEEVLERRRQDDIRMAATTAGPHRDNFTLRLGSRELALYGSRGEWRSALFALKAAEAEYLSSQSGEPPVLLFDDVFSELDPLRRDRLFPDTNESQSFITATDLTGLPTSLRKRAEVVEVETHARPV